MYIISTFLTINIDEVEYRVQRNCLSEFEIALSGLPDLGVPYLTVYAATRREED